VFNQSLADGNGTFINTEFSTQSADDEQTFLLVAEGQSSVVAQTIFDDAAHLHFFEDASQNIPRDAFAWGTTVYARADDLNSRPCWQIKWIDPNNNVVETHNLDASTSNTRNDPFVVPASGPSGVWRAELYRPFNSNSCASVPSFSLRYTLYFDVAQIVVIGADDSYITNQEGFTAWNSNSSLIFQYFLDVNNDDDDTEKTFLRFTLPSIPGNVISAKVRMRFIAPPNYSIFGSYPSRTYNINRVTGFWDVNAITFNLQPGVAGTPTDSQPTPTIPAAILIASPSNTMRWDVTSDVMGFAKHLFANNGWRIVDSEAQDPEGVFYSTEANTFLDSKLYGPVLLMDTEQVLPTPAMTEWGMIIFMVLAGLGSVYYLRRQGKANR
jgi:hypothetical protein